MFAGFRPGFVFKHGELGLGYYRDGLAGATSTAPVALASVAAAHEATDADDKDGANTGALPSGFFDNPQLDPANRNKEVALTKKQQTLNEAFDEFNELVQADLQAADAVAQRARVPWIIVCAHVPMYASDGNNDELIKDVEPLLFEFGVDLHLVGHNHY